MRVREAFTTRAFNDNCLFGAYLSHFVLPPTHLFAIALIVCYDYHPNSKSLYELYFNPKSSGLLHGQLSGSMGRIPEATLWSYIIQIANAIRVAHEAGLALRMIDPAKILLTGKNR